MLMGVVSKLVPDAICKDTIDSLNVCRYQRTLKERNVCKTVNKEVKRRKRGHCIKNILSFNKAVD